MNKKLNLLIIIFLLLGPILDVTSFLGLPCSILVRSTFLIGIILYLLWYKKSLKLLIPLLAFGLVNLLYQYLYLKSGMVTSISASLKFLYLPVSILFFNAYQVDTNKDKLLLTVLITYLSIYLLSYVFKIGADAYLPTDGKSGFKGLFSSINEFSAIIVGLLPISLTYLKKKEKCLLFIFVLLASIGSSLLIGTKVLMGGILFTVFYLLYQERDKLFFKKSKKGKIMIIGILIISIICGSILFTKTRTYQNMVIQNSFFKVDKILSLDFVNKVIYNDRLSFLSDNYQYFKSQNIIKILFGIGLTDNKVKMVEIDIFDIIFRYGVIGFITFIIPIISSIKWKNIRKVDKISLLLFLIISLTSGHVLIYPAVSIYMAFIQKEEIEVGDKFENRNRNYSL